MVVSPQRGTSGIVGLLCTPGTRKGAVGGGIWGETLGHALKLEEEMPDADLEPPWT